MSSKTTNYNLHKIDLTDAPPDITVLNQNWDKIDQELFKTKPFIVNLIDNGSAYVADKTFSEVLAAYNAGRVIKALYDNRECPLVYTDENSVVFALFEVDTSITITLTSINDTIFHTMLFAPDYSYGTSDLTAGTSQLETGKLHFVYE